jgi:translation elongation factor EF-4
MERDRERQRETEREREAGREREFDLDLFATAPFAVYQVCLENMFRFGVGSGCMLC